MYSNIRGEICGLTGAYVTAGTVLGALSALIHLIFLLTYEVGAMNILISQTQRG